MTLYKLALRFDREISAVVKYLTDTSVAGFGVREVADSGEHWHFYVETAMKVGSFRQAIRRAVPSLVGNGSYSVAETRDSDKYLRYICKGASQAVLPETIYKCGLLWTDEKISELHDDYWTEARAMKKRRVGSVMDHVLDVCRDEGVAWDDRAAIAEAYINELVVRNKPINIYSVKSCVNLIQVKLCPSDQAIKELAQQIHI